MGFVAMLVGLLGFVAVIVGVATIQPALFFGGGGASLAALILGFLGREGGASAKAGIVLGVLGTAACAAVFLLFTTGRQVEAPPRAIEVKGSVEAAPPAKDATPPAKVEPRAKITLQPTS